MNRILKTALPAVAGSALMAMAVLAPTGAAAAPLSQPLALGNTVAGAPVENVQYRRGWQGNRGHWNHRPHYRPHYRGWGGPGPIIGGLAAGAIIGSALAPRVYAAPPAYRSYATGDAVRYCMQRFRSYDPASGTYLGYDGLRHPCP